MFYINTTVLSIAACCLTLGAFARVHAKLADESLAREKAVKLRQAERKGRIKAEVRLKEVLAQQQDVKPSEDNKETEPITHHPIGHLRSCYKTRNGTPRQGVCVSSARSVLQIPNSVINAEAALEGLAEYSHVWLIYSFHANTNMARGTAIKAKISPPRLGGKDKVGLYSTRTPHRPNNIGLSLVRLEKVEGRKVYFLGADLIDMTPILDLKPYIPYADVADGDVRFPDWIVDPPAAPFKSVTIADAASTRLNSYVLKRLKLYKGESTATVQQLIRDVLIHDIRSGHQKGGAENTRYELFLDNMKIEWVANGDTASVESIEIASASDIAKHPDR